MWINYALATLAVLSLAAALFCWRLYKDAIRREIATSEGMCGVLLSPLLHIEFQNIAYETIGNGFRREQTILPTSKWYFSSMN
jgi:hypothetical protein